MSPWTGGRVTSSTVWRGVIALNTLLAATALVLSAYFFTRNAVDQDQLRNSLIESCKTVSVPQRQALIGVLEDQIAQSRAGDLERFFPQIPPRQLHRLIHNANRDRQVRINQLQRASSCTERFK